MRKEFQDTIKNMIDIKICDCYTTLEHIKRILDAGCTDDVIRSRKRRIDK